MLDEREEFSAYTDFPKYEAKNKYDSTYLGRFTFDMLVKFEGLSRVLTILARGYMWDSEEPDIDRAGRALKAWCSIPDRKGAGEKKPGQSETDFRVLASEFPKLVTPGGAGWFYRHVHNVIRFSEKNPDKLLKASAASCAALKKGFDTAWRNKLMQFQVPMFSPATKGAWIMRFDDILADAKEEGPLRPAPDPLSENVLKKLAELTPQKVPETVLPLLVQYYYANKPEDSEWVVLPVSNFDAYFGTTAFSRRWLPALPEAVIERSVSGYGVSRYKCHL